MTAATASGGRLAAVVLNFRSPHDTRLAVASLLRSDRPIDDVVVIDNDSGTACRDALAGDRASIRFFQSSSNIGFSGGMNAGIKAALAEGATHVLLVNSDVIVPPDLPGGLERALFETAGAGIAAPVVLMRSSPHRTATAGIAYSLTTGRMRQEEFGRPFDWHNKGRTTVTAVSGCLMLVDARVFATIGLLDEEYFFSFEDIDFCLRARRAGFAAVLDRTLVAYHEGGRSLDARSATRLYYASRNHLRLSRRLSSGPRGVAACRAVGIVGLNLLHAMRGAGTSRSGRVAAVLRGVGDHLRGRYGAAARG